MKVLWLTWGAWFGLVRFGLIWNEIIMLVGSRTGRMLFVIFEILSPFRSHLLFLFSPEERVFGIEHVIDPFLLFTATTNLYISSPCDVLNETCRGDKLLSTNLRAAQLRLRAVELTVTKRRHGLGPRHATLQNGCLHMRESKTPEWSLKNYIEDIM